MELKKLREFISNNDWRFAKTMPESPHWYVVRNECLDLEFTEFAMHIRLHGIERLWGNRSYIYLDIDGYSYWTMGNPIEETTIINRAECATEAN
jgi:hypothetical protein